MSSSQHDFNVRSPFANFPKAETSILHPSGDPFLLGEILMTFSQNNGNAVEGSFFPKQVDKFFLFQKKDLLFWGKRSFFQPMTCHRYLL